jgi:hypothetical protein
VLQTQILKAAVWPGWTLLLENGATDTQSCAGFGGVGVGVAVGVGVGVLLGVGEGDGLLSDAGLVLGPGVVERIEVGLGFGLAVGDGLVVAAGLVLELALGDAAARGPVVISDTTLGPAPGRTAQPFVALSR